MAILMVHPYVTTSMTVLLITIFFRIAKLRSSS